MRRLGFIAFVLAAGCGGDDDNTVPGAAAGVFPENGFIGRSLQVEVSGDTTSWDSAATLDFGPGVSVTKIEVVSPQALLADIKVDSTAAPGKQDVTVTEGSETFTLSQAFELKTPIDLSLTGTVAQGSIAFLSITNLDLLNPFDTTTDDNGDFVNVSITGPDGVTFQISSVAESDIEAVALINFDAAASGPLVVASGGSDVVVSQFGALDIAARTATEITIGTPSTGTLADPVGTALLHFVPGAGPALVTADMSSTDANANPQLVIVPTGHFEDGFTIAPLSIFGFVLRAGYSEIEATTAPSYAIFFDNSGDAAVPFSVDVKSTALTGTDEVATANDTPAQAQVFATPNVYLKTASLSDADDVDFVTFNVVAGDAGKQVRVITNTLVDPLTDTVVEVLAGTTAADAVSIGGTSDDFDFGEDWLSEPIPAGTKKIFIAVSASSVFDVTHKNYELAASLVAAPATVASKRATHASTKLPTLHSSQFKKTARK